MQDLKEVTQETHYENFRAAQLSGGKTEDSTDAPVNGKRYMLWAMWISSPCVVHFFNWSLSPFPLLRTHQVPTAMLDKDRALKEKEEEVSVIWRELDPEKTTWIV